MMYIMSLYFQFQFFGLYNLGCTQFITMIVIKKKIWGTSDMNFRAYTYVEYHIKRQF